ncbi:MAG: hypothetical protein GY851_07370 [bacterium]|nr:hypothetical protein [bacterium]
MNGDDIKSIWARFDKTFDKLDTITTSTHSIDNRVTAIETKLDYLPGDEDITRAIEQHIEATHARPAKASVPPASRRTFGLTPETASLIRWVVGAILFAAGGGTLSHFVL